MGNPYDVIDPGIAFKVYPCGTSDHPPVEATLHLVEEHKINPGEVQAVLVKVRSRESTIFPYPELGLGGQENIRYCVAVALVHGQLRPHHFTDEAIKNPKLRAMAERVIVEDTEEATREVSRPSTVVITLANGREVSYRVQLKGYPANPLTPQELDDKFRDCSHGVLPPDRVEAAIDRFHHLEELPNVAPLASMLGGKGA